MPRRSNLFQDVVGILHRHMAGEATVEESAFLRDRLTGEDREVDVVIRGGTAGYETTIAVEASATGRRASVEWVERMLGKHQHLPSDKLVLVSESGFTAQARRRAEASGAIALAPEDLTGDDPAFRVVNATRSLWPKQISLTPDRIGLTIDRRGDEQPWEIELDQMLFLADGTPAGGLEQVTRALIGASMPRIAEQIGLADIAEDIDRHFVLQVGPPWTVDINDERQHFFVAGPEGVEGGLRRVDALHLVGRAEIHVSEIELRHRRLGETTFSYGTGNVGAAPALVVATESESGGTLTVRFRGSEVPPEGPGRNGH